MKVCLAFLFAACILLLGCSDGGGSGRHASNGANSTVNPAGDSAGGGDNTGDTDDGGNDDDGDEDDGDDGDNNGCDYSLIDESWRHDADPVWFFNSQFYNNRTVRWPNGAVHVKVSDWRVDIDTLQTILDEINVWAHPTRLVIVNHHAAHHDIEIKYAPESSHWGNTAWLVDSRNHIHDATVEMGEFDEIDCHFYAVLKHHLIQAMGFFNYTEDGGVMTAEIYNDRMTHIVQETLFLLYELPAGAEVNSDGSRGDD